jgi:hypothetical protein
MRDASEATRLRHVVAVLESEVVERRAERELELEDLQLAIVRLRSRARRCSASAGAALAALLGELEAEVAALEARADVARSRTVAKLGAALGAFALANPGMSGTTRVVARELSDLEQRCASLRGEQRRLSRVARADARTRACLDTAKAELAALSRAGAAAEARLDDERLLCAELAARAHLTEEEIEQLRLDRAAIDGDSEPGAAEVQGLRALALQARDARDREAVVDRFVTKHAARRNPLYMSRRASADIATADDALQRAVRELDLIEAALQGRAPAAPGDEPASLLAAKLRVELGKQHAAVLDALRLEEETTHALVAFVDAHPTSALHAQRPTAL